MLVLSLNIGHKQVRGGQEISRRGDGIGFLEQLEGQKVRVLRKHHHPGGCCQNLCCSSSSSVLELEYFEEAGACLGPTSGFYALVSKDLVRKDLKTWRN
ncbi:uncharacterized protein C8R40DRAFT_835180 [Lentinula edodes]|uniref:uncharacterized protein n=1 Tax=Lentinula edodes TaxID=5353 RepID=UPI001E8E1A61|nr:uncharacterized protein C8R40DRAFT_835180 [Lentinula edodes]KAH7878281.1 hypothetical protein C8R40DRAFT_835180 [Lentinula edodes]